MKKTVFYVSVLMTIFMGSCQKETQQEDTNTLAVAQRADWLTANLDAKFAQSQKRVAAYLFEPKALSELINTPKLDHVRFVLSYENVTLQISAVGVDSHGKELISVASNILMAPAFAEKLSILKTSPDNTAKRTAIVAKHVLSPKIAFSGIEAWQEKLLQVSDLDDVTSYGGERIHHFWIETAVVQEMIKNPNTAKVALFLGLNSEGKMTTIFVGLDKNNTIRTRSSVGKGVNAVDDIYDFSSPCPTCCDPTSPI